MTKINIETFEFLADIAQNNNREWFNQNKDRYLEAKENLTIFAENWLHALMTFDESLRDEHKPYVFRIYRDARFAKGRPYKNNLGILLVKGGRANMHSRAGYYLHIQPYGCFLAGGSYMPPNPWLHAIRDDIDESPENFKKILKSKDFKSHFSLEGQRLKTAPRGYDKNHPEIDLLRYKSFMALEPFSHQKVMSKGFFDLLIKSSKALHPFNQYLNKLIP